jgi:hypothetical protein
MGKRKADFAGTLGEELKDRVSVVLHCICVGVWEAKFDAFPIRTPTLSSDTHTSQTLYHYISHSDVDKSGQIIACDFQSS